MPAWPRAERSSVLRPGHSPSPTAPPQHAETRGGTKAPSRPPHPTGPPHSAPRAYFGSAIFAFLRHPVNIERVRLKGGGSAPKVPRPPPPPRGVTWGRRETPIPKRDGTPRGPHLLPRTAPLPAHAGLHPPPTSTRIPTAGRDAVRCPSPSRCRPQTHSERREQQQRRGHRPPHRPARSGPAPRPGPAPPRRAVPLGGAAGKRAHGGTGSGMGAWGQRAGAAWGHPAVPTRGCAGAFGGVGSAVWGVVACGRTGGGSGAVRVRGA